MTDLVTNAVAEAAVEETATEAVKQSWTIPEMAVLGFAIIGAITAGKKAAKGIIWCKNKVLAMKDQKAADAEVVEVEAVDICDSKEVEKKTEKK